MHRVTYESDVDTANLVYETAFNDAALTCINAVFRDACIFDL